MRISFFLPSYQLVLSLPCSNNSFINLLAYSTTNAVVGGVKPSEIKEGNKVYVAMKMMHTVYDI
jgi:hypothetical protein